MKIALKNVSKSFGAVKAVDSVSFETADGECFFLLGPSGCGKTTVLRMVAGFYAPDSGEVFFDGEIINEVPAHRRNAGMVFQNYALWPHLTVEENIAFGLTVPGRNLSKAERAEKVGKMAALLHLEGLARRMPGQLSGGQQQRVALARALVVQPACLLLDEPLSNLDAKLRMEMRLEIRHIIKELGITAVYVTHDQAETLAMADRCAVMRSGKIEQLGTPRELYEQPASRFIADFMGFTNIFNVQALPAETGRLSVSFAAGRLVAAGTRTDWPEGAKLAAAIRPEKIRIGDWPASAPNVFPGRIREIIYQGSAFEYRVDLAGGLEVHALHPGTLAGAGAGGEVQVKMDPADVVVLPGETG